ncbi:MAG TPA: VOC family protein [Actinobacteria bacterium]|nr:VOC family protein [Actinomycetota bacterium]HDL48470.1 VOC family protein [Actinomycetota bacterium]
MADFALDDAGTILAVTDFEASVDFYTKNLGLEPVMTFDDPPFAILGRGSFRLCLAEEGHPADDCPGVVMRAQRDPKNPPIRLVLWVPDCAAAYEALSKEGVRFLAPPAQLPWGGSRCFAVDPDGYLVEIEELAAEE